MSSLHLRKNKLRRAAVAESKNLAAIRLDSFISRRVCNAKNVKKKYIQREDLPERFRLALI